VVVGVGAAVTGVGGRVDEGGEAVGGAWVTGTFDAGTEEEAPLEIDPLDGARGVDEDPLRAALVGLVDACPVRVAPPVVEWDGAEDADVGAEPFEPFDVAIDRVAVTGGRLFVALATVAVETAVELTASVAFATSAK
jgi:hypothetical protein